MRHGNRWIHHLLEWSLRAGRLYAAGYRNYQAIQIRHRKQGIRGWPRSLEGLRILQLSDLHVDLDPVLVPAVCHRLKGLSCELAVLTGDFWEGAHADPEPALAGLRRILEALGQPPLGIHGVPGNHDNLEILLGLERLGVRLLVNEARILELAGQPFCLAGVEDAFYYQLAEPVRAARQCPAGLPRILLSHSPQIAAEAEAAGFALMLSGHTHGGQICLPSGRRLARMPEVPSSVFVGPWQSGSLSGFTSTGTGACHLPIRFNCPPEIVLHELHGAD